MQLGGRHFELLPIFTGRGNGRKPFVVLASARGGQRDMRIIKFAFYHKSQLGIESRLLRKLAGTPGVVQIDTGLSKDDLYTNDDGRTRSMLALKTVGHPLCSCETVLEFLEAMYDLLEGKATLKLSSGLGDSQREVLRYLVQEKGIIHRDVSWSNVLINPKDYSHPTASGRPPALDSVLVQEDGAEEMIPHKYRFISDIYGESR